MDETRRQMEPDPPLDRGPSSAASPEPLTMIQGGPPPRRGRANVRASDFLVYRGGAGMYGWLMHRIAGVAILAFLFAHILDTALLGWGPEVYNTTVAIYRRPIFRAGEILLFGALLYHSINGLRVVAIDFWPQMNLYHKPLWFIALAVSSALFVFVAIWMMLAIPR